VSAEANTPKEPPRVKMVKPDARLVGEWNGTLQAGAALRLRFAIRDAGETMIGKLVSLDQGNATLEANRIGEVNGKVRIEIDAIGGSFEGEWNEPHDELRGEWRQLTQSFPFTLKRAAVAADR
jgi:hypothetical protein